MERKRVGIVVFENVEVLDFCGPFEVFSVTRMHDANPNEEPSPFEVLLVAERAGPVTTSGGMRVLPHCTFASCPRLDILLAPGGWGTRKELKNPVMLDWLRARAAEAEILTIDMALKVVAHCLGENIARASARYMEYPYPESDARRVQI